MNADIDADYSFDIYFLFVLEIDGVWSTYRSFMGPSEMNNHIVMTCRYIEQSSKYPNVGRILDNIPSDNKHQVKFLYNENSFMLLKISLSLNLVKFILPHKYTVEDGGGFRLVTINKRSLSLKRFYKVPQKNCGSCGKQVILRNMDHGVTARCDSCLGGGTFINDEYGISLLKSAHSLETLILDKLKEV